MRIRKVQAKIEKELEDHVKELPDFNGMSNYIRTSLIQRSKFKIKKEKA